MKTLFVFNFVIVTVITKKLQYLPPSHKSDSLENKMEEKQKYLPPTYNIDSLTEGSEEAQEKFKYLPPTFDTEFLTDPEKIKEMEQFLPSIYGYDSDSTEEPMKQAYLPPTFNYKEYPMFATFCRKIVILPKGYIRCTIY